VNAAETQTKATGRSAISPGRRRTLIDTVMRDFEAADRQATDRERLANLETLTRVLADAVVAISEALAPTVRTMQSDRNSARAATVR
jgi:hypothetical protein